MKRQWLIRAARPDDAAAWVEMREALWPSAADEHAREVEEYFGGSRRHAAEVLLACDTEGAPVGFAEVSIRTYAEGCASDRVGYLEGWYVAPGARRRGVGRALVQAAESWAIEQGCTEFASDTELDNAASAAAHRALGFEEVERAICFRKPLDPPSSLPHADESHEGHMRRCLALARRAMAGGDVPVGAIVVIDGRSAGEGIESVRRRADVTAHAEIEALRAASLRRGSCDLSGATLYTTVEPCGMCAHAIRLARVATVVAGARAADANHACGGPGVLSSADLLPSRPVTGLVRGVLRDDCEALLAEWRASR